jgi:hypothetical protein
MGSTRVRLCTNLWLLVTLLDRHVYLGLHSCAFRVDLPTFLPQMDVFARMTRVFA